MRKTTHTYEYKQLLRKLKEARKRAGLNQTEAATLLGRNQSFISKIESGERRLDVLELWEISRAYKQPLDLILSDILTEK